MADDVLRQARSEQSLIHMSDGHEVRYWTTHLGVTVECLRLAVDKVGNSAAAVRQHLGKTDQTEE